MSGHRTNPPHVLTATTRRVWSDDEKRSILAEADGPGVTLSMVARRHAIHSSLLFRWRRLALAAERAAASPASAMFVPLALPGPLEAPQAAATVGTIEIELADGHRLRVEGTVDPGVLRGVIEALVGR